jgi:uncharacterized RDD family membrane protein YckC
VRIEERWQQATALGWERFADAGLAQRGTARLLDLLGAAGVTFLILLLDGNWRWYWSAAAMGEGVRSVAWLLVLVSAGYEALFALLRRRTPGKRKMGVRLVRGDGREPGPARVFLRTLLLWLSVAGGVGLVWLLFDGRGLHGRLTNTLAAATLEPGRPLRAVPAGLVVLGFVGLVALVVAGRAWSPERELQAESPSRPAVEGVEAPPPEPSLPFANTPAVPEETLAPEPAPWVFPPWDVYVPPTVPPAESEFPPGTPRAPEAPWEGRQNYPIPPANVPGISERGTEPPTPEAPAPGPSNPARGVVLVNGRPSGASMFVRGGRSYVAVRPAAEALGWEVSAAGRSRVRLRKGSRTATLPMRTRNGTGYVPARDLAALGVDVHWDPKNRTVHLASGPQ